VNGGIAPARVDAHGFEQEQAMAADDARPERAGDGRLEVVVLRR
jgi:hypothetical protein